MSTEIKAIETVYNGYRFRSRLEARWAVFFDELGVKYEYEKEGYDLGELGWYLPDFWLPDLNMHVEIKPPKNDISGPLKIYLAGRMETSTSHDDWRGMPYMNEEEYERTPSMYTIIDGGHIGVGPYRLDLWGGHGKGHGETSGLHGDMSSEMRVLVRGRCLTQIRDCDVFYAWVDSLECYGTFAEIGYARGQGKPLVIAYDESLDVNELWFVLGMAEGYAVRASGPWEGFKVLTRLTIEEQKIAALSTAGAESMLISGDLDDTHLAVHFQRGEAIRRGQLHLNTHKKKTLYVLPNIWSTKSDEVDSALLAGKQARYEHGENGRRAA